MILCRKTCKYIEGNSVIFLFVNLSKELKIKGLIGEACHILLNSLRQRETLMTYKILLYE